MTNKATDHHNDHLHHYNNNNNANSSNGEDGEVVVDVADVAITANHQHHHHNSSSNTQTTHEQPVSLVWVGSYAMLHKGRVYAITLRLTSNLVQIERKSNKNNNNIIPSSATTTTTTTDHSISSSLSSLPQTSSSNDVLLESYHIDEIVSTLVLPYEEISSMVKKKSLFCHKWRRQNTGTAPAAAAAHLGDQLLESGVCVQLVVYGKKYHQHGRSLRRRSNGGRRQNRQVITLLINTHSEFNDNLNEAKLLQSKFSSVIIQGHACSKPVLIILNPKSGKGKTMKIFKKQVKPILDDCEMKYHVLVTKYANHACEFIQQNNNDLTHSYSAVVTVSGDGLLYEVVNGFVELIENSDQSSCPRIPIPICIIPGGTGNGLAHSINHIYLQGDSDSSHSSNDLFDCTFHLIKGQPTDMDIVRISTSEKVYYSFLSFGWGLLSDVDIESERLRCIGEPRFAVWSIYRSLIPRKYRGTLCYLPVEKSGNGVESGSTSTTTIIPSLDQPLSDSWVVESGNFLLVYAAYQTYLNSTCKFAPDSTLTDETIYLLYIKEGVSFCQILQFLLALEEGVHIKLPFVHFLPVKAFRLIPDGTDDIMTIDGEQIQCAPLQAEVLPRLASILMRT